MTDDELDRFIDEAAGTDFEPIKIKPVPSPSLDDLFDQAKTNEMARQMMLATLRMSSEELTTKLRENPEAFNQIAEFMRSILKDHELLVEGFTAAVLRMAVVTSRNVKAAQGANGRAVRLNCATDH